MPSKLINRSPRKKKEGRETKESAVAIPKMSAASLDVVVDFPKEEELVLPGHYAIRLSAAENSQVEVAINDGAWNAARAASGFYWLDWAPAELGETVIKARVRTGNGRWKNSAERICIVSLK